ncbi:MAG: YqaE/Pmp3 family membrane protein [Victivallales bacterium]|nr:YqaE/Pmp3 family membrane protein [Victivallales bacterium]
MPTWLRILFCIFFLPLAVLDKGLGPIIIVFLLTLCGWVPGVIGAILYSNK